MVDVLKFSVSAGIEIRCLILWLLGLSETPSLTKHKQSSLKLKIKNSTSVDFHGLQKLVSNLFLNEHFLITLLK